MQTLLHRKTLLPAVLDLSVVVLPVALGVIVGKWPEDVAKAELRVAPSFDAISWPATAFWTTCALAFVVAVGNVIRTRADASRGEDLARMRDHAIGLQSVVDSLTSACRDAMAKYGKQHPDAALRVLLDTLAQIAWFFDGKPAARYATNVMIYVPAERASEDQFLRLSFWDGARTELRGMLDLQCDWSTAMGTTAARDPMLTPLALPVPKEEKRKRQAPRSSWRTTGVCTSRLRLQAGLRRSRALVRKIRLVQP